MVDWNKRSIARHWIVETLTTKTGMSTRGGGLVLGRRSDVDSATVGASRPAWRLPVGPTSQLLRRVANDDMQDKKFSCRPRNIRLAFCQISKVLQVRYSD